MQRAACACRTYTRRATCARSGFRIQVRLASTNAQEKTAGPSERDYQHTILLPKAPIPPYPEPQTLADKFGPITTASLYRYQSEQRKGEELFVLHDGPPYANGNLHIGHAVNKILKDIINRYQALQGKRVYYIPGWDCHGLPIENKALKQLGTSADELSPSEIRKTSHALAATSVGIQRKEFEQMQLMADFSEASSYRTYDHRYEMKQLVIFQQMVGKGVIVRRNRPIWWSPASRTALAEGELEYEPAHKSKSVYVKFPVPRQEMSQGLGELYDRLQLEQLSFLVWTTTPWTLPANMGVAYNSEINYVVARSEKGEVLVLAADTIQLLPERIRRLEILETFPGRLLEGTKYRHFFQSPEAPPNPVFPAEYVKPDSGTGLVHSAPGHGAEDYQAMTALGLLKDREILSPVDGDGQYTADILKLVPDKATGDLLLGKDVQTEGTDEVLRLLLQADASIALKQIKHRYPYDWKTKTPVITRMTSQWFADIANVKEKALKALQEVKFHPVTGRARLEAFIRGRTEWCISRQRSWGVPIPALNDVETGEAHLTVESMQHILGVLRERGTDYWWSGPVEDFIPPYLQGRNLRKGADTMDVWFDSGTSWSVLSKRSNAAANNGPIMADVCLEGSDQHRGWFQSLLLTRIISASEGEEKAPYKAVITHGFVMDENGKKMSKSDGNVTSPMLVINGGGEEAKYPRYGADVLRLWTASSDYTSDMSVGPKIIKQAQQAYRKLRNSARYMLGVLATSKELPGDPLASLDPESLGLVERWILDRVYLLASECNDAYASWQFHRVVHALTDFSTRDLSALYFDINKDTVYCDPEDNVQRTAVVSTMAAIFKIYKMLLAPITPLAAEELHAAEMAVRGEGGETDIERQQRILLGDDWEFEPDASTSVFMNLWPAVPSSWEDPVARAQMNTLLEIRSTVLRLLEKARNDKHIGSPQEAVVHLTPREAEHPVVELLRESEKLLPSLFTTSYAYLHSHELSSGPARSEEWSYSEDVVVDGRPLSVSVGPSPDSKCPRCWMWTREENAELCKRCADVVA